MKSRILIATAIAASALALSGCEVEQTEEGEMPEVDVEGGEMPEYDVDAPDVDVRMEEENVEVPEVDVDTEEKTMNVPKIDVDPQEEDEDPDPPDEE